MVTDLERVCVLSEATLKRWQVEALERMASDARERPSAPVVLADAKCNPTRNRMTQIVPDGETSPATDCGIGHSRRPPPVLTRRRGVSGSGTRNCGLPGPAEDVSYYPTYS